MVDGVFASCYASADHDVSDVVITPIQWLPWITECVFGDDNGLQAYVSLLEHVGRWVLPYNF